MKDLVLKIDDKARERIAKMGGEIHIYTGVVGAGWAARKAALVGSGKPNFDDCSLLRDGDISVWVPNTMGFLNDTVEIQLTGFLWNTNLVATSAKIDLMDRRSCGA